MDSESEKAFKFLDKYNLGYLGIEDFKNMLLFQRNQKVQSTNRMFSTLTSDNFKSSIATSFNTSN
jgi:Ca2+-binding EF-hand superfamily protein